MSPLAKAKCMSNKVALIVFIIVASLLVAGCTVSVPIGKLPTPTPSPTLASKVTPTPNVDYSSILTKRMESTNFIIERPFTKSTNTRGNDVYKGVGRNATQPNSESVTLVFELVGTKAEAKQVFDKEVAIKLNDGYIFDAKETARDKAESPSVVEAWDGDLGQNWFYCGYRYETTVDSWMVFTQSP